MDIWGGQHEPENHWKRSNMLALTPAQHACLSQEERAKREPGEGAQRERAVQHMYMMVGPAAHVNANATGRNATERVNANVAAHFATKIAGQSKQINNKFETQ